MPEELNTEVLKKNKIIRLKIYPKGKTIRFRIGELVKHLPISAQFVRYYHGDGIYQYGKHFFIVQSTPNDINIRRLNLAQRQISVISSNDLMKKTMIPFKKLDIVTANRKIVKSTKGYQVTIPIKCVRTLNLKIGDPITFNWNSNKCTVIIKARR